MTDASEDGLLEDRNAAEVAFVFVILWIGLQILTFWLFDLNGATVLIVPVVVALLALIGVFGVFWLEERIRGGPGEEPVEDAGRGGGR